MYLKMIIQKEPHDKVLKRLLETNMEQLPGYGTDPYCASAAEKIRKACGCPEA